MSRTVHVWRPILAALGLLVLGTAAAPAQRQEETPPAATDRGPIRDGLRVPIPREATTERERAAGVARPEEREAAQLRDLNALSRQLAPEVPVPAPSLAPDRAGQDPAPR